MLFDVYCKKTVYSPKLGQGSNPNVHQQRNDWRCVHIYNGILLSYEKEQNNAICSNIDGPRDYQTKWSKSYKYTVSLTCGIQ